MKGIFISSKLIIDKTIIDKTSLTQNSTTARLLPSEVVSLAIITVLYMIDYRFLSQPTEVQVCQIIALYREAGWWSLKGADTEILPRLIAGSHCFLIALDDEKIIGMGRAISDRTCDAYIQDVTVHPAYRQRGIGSHIVRQIINRIVADGIRWIGLIAEQNSAPFYGQFGFTVMPESSPLLLIKYE